MDERKIKETIRKNGNERLAKALENGDMDAVINALSPDQAAMFQQLVSDKKAADELLSSPQAAALMKSLFGKS